MKTEFDMVTDIIGVIDVPAIKSLINGVIIGFNRPKSSKKSDVVVTSLALTNEPLQEGIANINVHFPNLGNISFDNVADNTQPDSVNIDQVCKAIIPLINGKDFETFSIFIDEPPMITRDNDGGWFGNIRAYYNSFQNDYKNI